MKKWTIIFFMSFVVAIASGSTIKFKEKPACLTKEQLDTYYTEIATEAEETRYLPNTLW
jgi:hypothetical protein